MKIKCIVLLLFFQFSLIAQPKIVGMLTVRNEDIFVENCLRALSLYTDAIVILDDASTTNMLDIVESIAEECNIERILKKEKWYRDEPGDKNKLLQAAREIGGTHFVFVDADEMFTANCLDNDFLRKKILSLMPGDRLYITFYNLWRSHEYYRDDTSVWKPRYIEFALCDDGHCSHQGDYVHVPHLPTNLKGRRVKITDKSYGLLHFQFINWRNLLIKQNWYRCLERIRQPHKSDKEIVASNAASKDESNLKVTKINSNWLNYSFFDPSILKLPEIWRERQILDWFEQYGKDHFKNLSIWDVEWGSFE